MPDTTGAPWNWRTPLGDDLLKIGVSAIRNLAADIAASMTGVSNRVASFEGPIAALRQTISIPASGSPIAGSAWTALAWDVADKDTHTGYNKTRTGAGATSDTRWTVPTGQAGTYEVQGQFAPANQADATTFGARVTKNGVVLPGTATLTINAVANGSPTVMSKIMPIDLAVGDYVEFQGFGSVAWYPRNTVGSDGICASMTVKRIR